MDNEQVAAIFYEVADILDLQGVPFKPNAYRRAARAIEELDEDISKLAAEGRLREIPGVGESVAKKIQEILKTGQLSFLNKLRAQIPKGLLELLSVPDVGPKTAMLLNRELGISNLEDLKRAIAEHKLRNLKGFGEKSEQRILRGIQTLEAKAGRMLLGEAYPVATAYVEYLKRTGKADKVSPAGSLRRGKETVGDIDILVGDDDPEEVLEAFVSYPEVDKVLMRGPTKSSVVLKNGIQVDIRVVSPESYGAALLYFTGSKDHNVVLRSMGVSMGMKLNEYGLFDRVTGKMLAGRTEEEVYRALGLDWIPPELREVSGEVEAAKAGKLPHLVEYEDIRGDLHAHTDWSDGAGSIEQMADAAIALGYEYLAITDHTQSLKIANGLTPERLADQVKAVRRLQDRLGKRLTLLAGTEVDIKADGSLDLPRTALKELDIIVGSVHSRFRMEKSEMTERVVKAIESGWIDVLGHPTGRIIGARDPYELDFDRVLEAARESSVALEVNCFPDRLDLRDSHCRLARDAKVKVALGTDAHRSEQLGYMKLGVITARRGWMEKGDVLNALTSKELMAHLRRRRR
ncbi:MAG: DNA polymerase/3'-5' exonuclease PolX [Thermoplasmata archaeon]